MNPNLMSIKNFGPDVKRRGAEMILKRKLSAGNRTAVDAKDNRTLPTLEEFLEFILVSSMEGLNDLLYSST